MSSGAAIAYYAIFALPPLLVVVFLLAGVAGISPDRINRVVKSQLGIPAGATDKTDKNEEGTQEKSSNPSESRLQSVADRAKSKSLGGVGLLGQIVGILVLLFTATGLFAQLQLSLNRAWDVEPDPEQGGIRQYFMKRLLSLGMILVMALLLLVSLVVSAVITQIIQVVQGAAPGMLVRITSVTLDNLLTFFVATLLFAAIFKVLPDAEMAWRDTWLGAAVTAGLFVLGKALIAWYMQRVSLGASWGDAAASIIAVLAWLYYTSLIVLLGAELTQVWANSYGQGTRPSSGARAAGAKRRDRQQVT